LIGNISDGSVEDKGFVIGEMIIGMIGETEQTKGVEVILVEEMVDDEEVLRDIWAIGKREENDKNGNTSF